MRPLPVLGQPETFTNLKICVLQPDYSTSAVDYQYYDPKSPKSDALGYVHPRKPRKGHK
jgi:hypothetical protein